MASKEKQAIVVDYVHSKRESRGEQPSETRGRHVWAAVNSLTRCRRKSLVTTVAIIVSIALLITVVLVGKYLMTTRYRNTIDLESDGDYKAPCCFSLLKKFKFNN